MSMTSNDCEIKKITNGYSIGKLYNGNIKDEIVLSKTEGVCFDKETYNFHLYPDNPVVMKDICEEVKELRKKIKEELSEKIEKELREKYKIEIIEKGRNGNICALKSEKYENANYLYKFISVKNNDGIIYTLNFMRFFVDKNKAVNCILKSIQFDRCVSERININENPDDRKCKICYPTSYQSQSEKRLESIIKNSNTGNFCYNPQVEFGNATAITKAFIDFIKACEENKK